MRLIPRFRWPVSGRAARIHQVRSLSRLLMRHVGLLGRVDCVVTRDSQGHDGLLLQIQTHLHVPLADRAQFETYFRRKLAEFGELGPRGEQSLKLLIRDGEEIAWSGAKVPAHISSKRIALILRSANPSDSGDEELDDRVAQMRESLRQRLSTRRQERIARDGEPRELLTDLGGLCEA